MLVCRKRYHGKGYKHSGDKKQQIRKLGETGGTDNDDATHDREKKPDEQLDKGAIEVYHVRRTVRHCNLSYQGLVFPAITNQRISDLRRGESYTNLIFETS